MTISKATSFLWKILLILIFLRPFISEHAFLIVGFWYISILSFLLIFYLIISNDWALLSPALNFSALLFIIAILISIISSGSSGRSLLELYLFMPNILIFYIISRIKPEQRKQLIATIFFAASIISIYAIYQYFIGFRHTLDYIRQRCPNSYIEEFLSRKRAFATFTSPNIFVSYILMMVFLGMGFLTSIHRKEKTIYWICIFIMAVSLLLTKSLGGILFFLITSILFILGSIFYLSPNLKTNKKINLKRTSLIIASLLFAFMLMAIFLLRQRIPQFINIKEPNNSIIQRFYYWKTSLKMIKDHPLTGIGWRKFGLLYEFYKPLSANISHYSHNVFLQIAAETGLLGLFSFLWLIFMFLKTGLRVIKDNKQEQALKIGLFIAACAFLLHNLIDLSFYFGQASFFWWIILGLFSNFSRDNA